MNTTFKKLLTELLYGDDVKTATIELLVGRNDFIKVLTELSISFEINEKFCNSNDWELTFHYRGLDCNVAIHSWMMIDDEVKVLILAGDESRHYYNKPTRDVLENTSMYIYHSENV